MARGFDQIPHVTTTVIVNVGDDETTYGLAVSPDLDTVVYTLANIEGPHGWGLAKDTFAANDQLARFGIDNTFQLGDRDLALKLFRTIQLQAGTPLSTITDLVRQALGVRSRILPATDDRLRTEIGLSDGTWISFQQYFVHRRHTDEVARLRFAGEETSTAAPGVIDSIETADLLLVAPSNPPLSIWPILAVPGIKEAVSAHRHTVAVSPLIGGKAVKGPADRVLRSLGLPPGNAGVASAYEGLIDRLVIDVSDIADAESLSGLDVQVADTAIADRNAARRLATAILAL